MGGGHLIGLRCLSVMAPTNGSGLHISLALLTLHRPQVGLQSRLAPPGAAMLTASLPSLVAAFCRYAL
jgi:hypothetical protein